MKVKIGNYPNHRFYHNWLYNWFGYSPKQRTSVKIHNYDTWSMDHTLAHIIVPMLKQLKATKHGHPFAMTEQEWDDILDEMIWAFEQKCRDDWMDDYECTLESLAEAKVHEERMTNGFRLFGTYYENLWD